MVPVSVQWMFLGTLNKPSGSLKKQEFFSTDVWFECTIYNQPLPNDFALIFKSGITSICLFQGTSHSGGYQCYTFFRGNSNMRCPLQSVKFDPFKFKSYSVFGNTLQKKLVEICQLISCRNQSIDLESKSTDWFPYNISFYWMVFPITVACFQKAFYENTSGWLPLLFLSFAMF